MLFFARLYFHCFSRQSCGNVLLMASKRAPRDPEEMAKVGRLGGKATLKKKGRKHFAKIAAMRKNHRGGRPKDAAREVV